MDTFIFMNPHPEGKRVSDCVKRACSLASGIDYHDIAIMLNRFRKETGARRFNSDDNWRQFIIRVLLGKDNGNMQYANGGHRFTVDEFAARHGRRAILQVAGHVVAIDGEGHYLDTWHSGYKSIYKAYDIPEREAIVKNIRDNFPALCKGLNLGAVTIRIG